MRGQNKHSETETNLSNKYYPQLIVYSKPIIIATTRFAVLTTNIHAGVALKTCWPRAKQGPCMH